jgi:hypothetical protein
MDRRRCAPGKLRLLPRLGEELDRERLRRIEIRACRAADVELGRERERMSEAEPPRRLEASLAALLAYRCDGSRELAGAVERARCTRRVGSADERGERLGVRLSLGVGLGDPRARGRGRLGLRGEQRRDGDASGIQ